VDLRVKLTKTVRASPARLWAACACAEGMANWQADEVRGRVATGERLELRWPALGASLEVKVTAMDPGRRLVLDADGSQVELTLEPGRVHLVQEGMTSDDEVEGAASSWQVSLALLAHYLDHHDGRARHVSWFVRPTQTTAGAAHLFFTEAAALRTWLTQSGAVTEPVSPVALRLAWGEPFTGQVLCLAPRRDVALSWTEEDNSVLALRTLPSPRSDDERLVAAVWSRWRRPPSRRTAEQLALAVERLGRVLDSSGAA
jgi:uncharacterized protein YndB with AHSA1/START domain